jgi:YnbE-like lipoprotein
MQIKNSLRSIPVTGGCLLLALVACTPTVQVAVPNEPITINLNVRIEHEIRVQVEEELDDIFTLDSGLF